VVGGLFCTLVLDAAMLCGGGGDFGGAPYTYIGSYLSFMFNLSTIAWTAKRDMAITLLTSDIVQTTGCLTQTSASISLGNGSGVVCGGANSFDPRTPPPFNVISTGFCQRYFRYSDSWAGVSSMTKERGGSTGSSQTISSGIVNGGWRDNKTIVAYDSTEKYTAGPYYITRPGEDWSELYSPIKHEYLNKQYISTEFLYSDQVCPIPEGKDIYVESVSIPYIKDLNTYSGLVGGSVSSVMASCIYIKPLECQDPTVDISLDGGTSWNSGYGLGEIININTFDGSYISKTNDSEDSGKITELKSRYRLYRSYRANVWQAGMSMINHHGRGPDGSFICNMISENNVFVAGGYNTTTLFSRSSELYNNATGIWSEKSNITVGEPTTQGSIGFSGIDNTVVGIFINAMATAARATTYNSIQNAWTSRSTNSIDSSPSMVGYTGFSITGISNTYCPEDPDTITTAYKPLSPTLLCYITTGYKTIYYDTMWNSWGNSVAHDQSIYFRKLSSASAVTSSLAINAFGHIDIHDDDYDSKHIGIFSETYKTWVTREAVQPFIGDYIAYNSSFSLNSDTYTSVGGVLHLGASEVITQSLYTYHNSVSSWTSGSRPQYPEQQVMGYMTSRLNFDGAISCGGYSEVMGGKTFTYKYYNGETILVGISLTDFGGAKIDDKR